ncbi:MAG: hypothetical protein AAFY84_17380 [Pseudomonadota bacterium]
MSGDQARWPCQRSPDANAVLTAMRIHLRFSRHPPTHQTFMANDCVGSGRKALMVGASFANQEDTMTLITRFELASLSQNQLRGLLRETFNALVRSAPDSPERRNALASIENIQRELADRGNSFD